MISKKKLSDVRQEPYSAYIIKISFLKLNLFFLYFIHNFYILKQQTDVLLLQVRTI